MDETFVKEFLANIKFSRLVLFGNSETHQVQQLADSIATALRLEKK